MPKPRLRKFVGKTTRWTKKKFFKSSGMWVARLHGGSLETCASKGRQEEGLLRFDQNNTYVESTFRMSRRRFAHLFCSIQRALSRDTECLMQWHIAVWLIWRNSCRNENCWMTLFGTRCWSWTSFPRRWKSGGFITKLPPMEWQSPFSFPRSLQSKGDKLKPKGSW